MKPNIHAQLSARKYGGDWREYLPIHEWFDQTKAIIPDMRHRMILHSAFGIYLATDFFGDYWENSVGKTVSVRDIGEEHMIQDLGFIPTLQDYIDGLDGEKPNELRPWYGGLPKSSRIIPMIELAD